MHLWWSKDFENSTRWITTIDVDRFCAMREFAVYAVMVLSPSNIINLIGIAGLSLISCSWFVQDLIRCIIYHILWTSVILLWIVADIQDWFWLWTVFWDNAIQNSTNVIIWSLRMYRRESLMDRELYLIILWTQIGRNPAPSRRLVWSWLLFH